MYNIITRIIIQFARWRALIVQKIIIRNVKMWKLDLWSIIFWKVKFSERLDLEIENLKNKNLEYYNRFSTITSDSVMIDPNNNNNF